MMLAARAPLEVRERRLRHVQGRRSGSPTAPAARFARPERRKGWRGLSRHCSPRRRSDPIDRRPPAPCVGRSPGSATSTRQAAAGQPSSVSRRASSPAISSSRSASKHPCPRLGKGPRRSEPDAAGGPGHDGHPLGEARAVATADGAQSPASLAPSGQRRADSTERRRRSEQEYRRPSDPD